MTLSHVKGFYFRLPGISYPITWQISYILHVSVILDFINIGVRIWLVSMVKTAPAGRCLNYTVVKAKSHSKLAVYFNTFGKQHYSIV